jgi:hypothetical protein
MPYVGRVPCYEKRESQESASFKTRKSSQESTSASTSEEKEVIAVRRRVSSYSGLVEEFGSKMVELEVTLEEMMFTRRLIERYLDSTVEEQFSNEDDWELDLAIQNYGFGNYEEALKDYEEYSVIFN